MINIPIQWSIVADSRDHDHSVGSELPHLSIKQENVLNLKRKRQIPKELGLVTTLDFLYWDCTASERTW